MCGGGSLNHAAKNEVIELQYVIHSGRMHPRQTEDGRRTGLVTSLADVLLNIDGNATATTKQPKILLGDAIYNTDAFLTGTTIPRTERQKANP